MHKKLDDRVTDARMRALDAETELALSRQRARSAKETVVTPMRRRAEDNQFAEMLRRSLYIGYGNGNGQ